MSKYPNDTYVSHNFLVALGGNLEPTLLQTAEILRSAISELSEGPGRITSVSRFFRSPAFPAGVGPDYVNAALAMESPETPQEFLARLHRIEHLHGRERETRWGARVLDLDLLACDGRVLPDSETQEAWRHLPLERQMTEAPEHLILPHPRIQDRAFVLVPLAEVAPDWVHPLLHRSVAEMCGDLPQADRDALTPLP
ncbi:2-amino-4-hydroxy-6-hydroxymethyldihydropteridinediphosphokinase [Pseudooceanicola antarcticus]|uniref:2-amino-4-hydroxy-6-hydroxymethyldihydropteridine pyrophosphokinase n=1 Tax=Pseudooceanicola antarcticus TaxID=1247613 RepID=A0A285HPA1_9RHOB|nr:2-amino-4-hydroxy-6-hydroxymethyldihydropteridine diphosphokinase [Pseudooceanicola antarcticus]PJE27848.1 2-amino-4-hydroxy-6-hydroxymethyldihydropteridine diphosphokinase [Pseudooceanicola antarcticus]SNY36511.1 2-amino-4-hydroxy-6-hydroxymethyldihydropteridinediphosphokinase [Pseudooceanicola antarcticus]